MTVVLLGKTGNGKSSAANQILGQELFETSDSAHSETQSCARQTRTEEREITVVDTPGVMDTALVKEMTSNANKAICLASTVVQWPGRAINRLGFRHVQEKTLRELARMVLLAPHGFDAILLVMEFGSRFTRDDCDALEMLKKFLGEDAKKYMILLLTHGDQAERNAGKKGISVDEHLKNWIDGMDDRQKTFIQDDLDDRVVLFNCLLNPDEKPEAYKNQLCKLIEVNCCYLTIYRPLSIY